PQLPPQPPGGVVAVLLPAAMVLGSVGFVFVGGLSPASMAMGGLMLMSTLAMAAGGVGGRRSARRSTIETGRRRYLGQLAGVRTDLARAVAAQRAASLWCHPDPEALWSLPGTERMWERRPTDAGF